MKYIFLLQDTKEFKTMYKKFEVALISSLEPGLPGFHLRNEHISTINTLSPSAFHDQRLLF